MPEEERAPEHTAPSRLELPGPSLSSASLPLVGSNLYPFVIKNNNNNNNGNLMYGTFLSFMHCSNELSKLRESLGTPRFVARRS